MESFIKKNEQKMQSSIFQNVMTLRPMDNAFDTSMKKSVEKKTVDDDVKKLREAIEQNISIPTESILYSEPESEPSSSRRRKGVFARNLSKPPPPA